MKDELRACVMDTTTTADLGAVQSIRVNPESARTYYPATPKFITGRWDPKPDITAYELALCLPLLTGEYLTREKWEALGPANRHIAIG
jgi:hypothetical protein